LNQELFNKRLEKAKLAKQKSYERMVNRKKETKQFKQNEILRLIRFSNKSGSYINHFIYYPNNTDLHEDTKFEVFKELRKKGYDVLVEPIFINNGRADILDITRGIIFEVIKSETIEMLEEKKKKYPPNLEVRIVDANKKRREEILENV